MRIGVGSDHRGILMKDRVREVLVGGGHTVEDFGATGDESVDYPDFAAQVAAQVSSGQLDRGVLICGTGIGMSIAANKFPGVRAAPCWDEVTAEVARRHNDLNVLCLSADLLSPSTADRMVQVWVDTEFEGGRHGRRVDKIAAIEKDGCC
ncbi:MAG: ribose 5-phosphate isomerase B [Planctomycetota bacterium]